MTARRRSPRGIARQIITGRCIVRDRRYVLDPMRSVLERWHAAGDARADIIGAALDVLAERWGTP